MPSPPCCVAFPLLTPQFATLPKSVTIQHESFVRTHKVGKTEKPAMPTRAAKSIVLICVGILLLSACGWSPPGPRLTPIKFEDFILWQTTPGLPPAILGFGRIEGS